MQIRKYHASQKLGISRRNHNGARQNVFTLPESLQNVPLPELKAMYNDRLQEIERRFVGTPDASEKIKLAVTELFSDANMGTGA